VPVAVIAVAVFRRIDGLTALSSAWYEDEELHNNGKCTEELAEAVSRSLLGAEDVDETGGLDSVLAGGMKVVGVVHEVAPKVRAVAQEGRAILDAIFSGPRRTQ
jgi:hypothetical protein